MSRKGSKRVAEDEDNDVSEDCSDQEAKDEFEDKLGLSLDELERMVRTHFKDDKLIKWLESKPKVIEFIRQVVLGLFDEYGISRKYDAASHPIWRNVTSTQHKIGFRNNPDMKTSHPQMKWLNSLKTAPKEGFPDDTLKTAVKFVSAYWRRHRYLLRKTIMTAVFADIWGTTEDPVSNAEEMSEYFKAKDGPGQKQLERWIVTAYIKPPDDLVNTTIPEEGLKQYVKAQLIHLRATYNSEEEMKRGEAAARKEEEGQDQDDDIRKDYEAGVESDDDAVAFKKILAKEKKKKEEAKRRIKEKRIKINAKTAAEEKNKKEGTKRKKKPEKNTAPEPSTKRQTTSDRDSSVKSTQAKSKTTSQGVKDSTKAKAKSAESDQSEHPSQSVQKKKTGSDSRRFETIESNDESEESRGSKKKTDRSKDKSNAEAPKTNKRKAVPSSPKRDSEQDDEDMAEILRYISEMDEEIAHSPALLEKKKVEKEKKGKKQASSSPEPEAARDCRSPENTVGSNTNRWKNTTDRETRSKSKGSKRTCSAAELSRSPSRDRKKSKK